MEQTEDAYDLKYTDYLCYIICNTNPDVFVTCTSVLTEH